MNFDWVEWSSMGKYIEGINKKPLYFVLGRAKLHWNFSSMPKDVSDIYRFFNRKWVLPRALLEISEYPRHPLVTWNTYNVLVILPYNLKQFTWTICKIQLNCIFPTFKLINLDFYVI